MNYEQILSIEKIKDAAKGALEHFETRISLERDRLMGFYDKDRLRGILDSTKNPDLWAEQIDKLSSPQNKFFDVAHNRYHLKITIKILLLGADRLPEDELKDFVVKRIAQSIGYFSGRGLGL